MLAISRLLVGRRIVAVDLCPFRDETIDGKLIKIAYQPLLTLDNGACITFHVQEIDCGDGYGVSPRYHRKITP